MQFSGPAIARAQLRHLLDSTRCAWTSHTVPSALMPRPSCTSTASSWSEWKPRRSPPRRRGTSSTPSPETSGGVPDAPAHLAEVVVLR
ncbi:hypothetical protein [Streptomyces sp. NPDC091217]|uniref:hypothetical protein n=1 Tax=Streptomyces sp. NPDC091217 TaxID=3365975 RepID=UPI0038109FBA